MKIIYILLITIAFQSCNDAKNRTTQDTLATLENDSETKISSYTRYDDVIEKLYEDLTAKNPPLQQLEKDIKAIQAKAKKHTNDYNKYESKSTDYYTSANSKIAYIKDSLLRAQIMDLVKKSQLEHSKNTSSLTALINSVNANNAAIDDYYTLLKIVLTLPLIEQYQRDNLPTETPFKETIEEQKKTVEEIKQLSPKL